MKGRRPTIAQRKIIDRELRLSSSDWLVQKNTPVLLQIVHRLTDVVRMYGITDGRYHLIGMRRKGCS